jgi:hypothetical protein
MDEKMDYRTPKERISAEMRKYLLAEEEKDGTQEVMARRCGCGCRNTNTKCREERDSSYDACKAETKGVHFAMVYSPYQPFCNLYEPEEGLENGTIFRDLNFPFYPTKCKTMGCGNR